MQAELGKLATLLAEKEKELKVSQEDLEAQKDEVLRMIKELADRDKERLTRGGASLDIEASTLSHCSVMADDCCVGCSFHHNFVPFT